MSTDSAPYPRPTLGDDDAKAMATRMTIGNDVDLPWFDGAVFVRTANNYWIAWREDRPTTICVLEPNHADTEPGAWIDARDGTDTLEKWIAYVESGEYDSDPPGLLNLFIENPEAGNCQ